jgi:hypothetical protein
MPHILEMKEIDGKLAVFLDTPTDSEGSVTIWTAAEQETAFELERSDAVTRVVIQVEKKLCELLNREWSPSGMSIETLVADIRARLVNIRPDMMDEEAAKALLDQWDKDRAPELDVRLAMVTVGLRELFAAVESGDEKQMKDAMDLARGLLMQSKDWDDFQQDN